MSAEDLRRMHAEAGFKPALPLWALAATHVDFDALTGRGTAESKLLTRIVQDDGLVPVIGPSGSGKSSLISKVVLGLATDPANDTPRHREGRHYVPVFIPVGRTGADVSDPRVFGRLALNHVRLTLGVLTKPQRRRLLRRGAAEQRTQLPSYSVNATLAAQVLPGVTERLGVELRSEVTTLLEGEIASPLGGLDELADMLRAHERELLVVLEDTDAWAFEPDGGTQRADQFFRGVLGGLASGVDFVSVVSVQDHWQRGDAYQALATRVVGGIVVPSLGDSEAVVQLIASRVRWVTDQAEVTVDDLIEPDAVELLAWHLRKSAAPRRVFEILRDTLDLLADEGEFPDRLKREHILNGAAR